MVCVCTQTDFYSFKDGEKAESIDSRINTQTLAECKNWKLSNAVDLGYNATELTETIWALQRGSTITEAECRGLFEETNLCLIVTTVPYYKVGSRLPYGTIIYFILIVL